MCSMIKPIHPNIFGYSTNKIPILSYNFGNEGPEILILAGVHGDEHEGIICAFGLLNHWLTKGFDYKIRLTLVPQFNIEGVMLKTRVNGNGVDLNRNLPTQDWSAEIKTPRYHPGPKPGSESENQALLSYLEKKSPKFILSLHSWNPMINVNGDCENEAKILAEMTHYKIESYIGYPTPGSLGTYCGIENRSPVITLEIEQGLKTEAILKLHVPAILSALFACEKRG